MLFFGKHMIKTIQQVYLNIFYIDFYKSFLIMRFSIMHRQYVGLIKARNTNHENNIMLSVGWDIDLSLRHYLLYCRTKLPVPMFDRNDFSVWTILKQCIGKVTWSHVLTTILLWTIYMRIYCIFSSPSTPTYCPGC